MVEQLFYKQVGADIPEVAGSNPATSTISNIFDIPDNADNIGAWILWLRSLTIVAN